MSQPPAPGFWLRGQIFSSTTLPELWQHWHHNSNHMLEQALQQGWVEIDGQCVTDGESILVPGQRFGFWLPDHIEDITDTGWHILWESNELLLVHKPAGLPVSRTTRNLFNTLISLVRRQTMYADAHLLHRLDAETSGAMLLAKDSHADRKWKKRFDRLLTGKEYLALVQGVPDWQQLECRSLLAERTDSAIRSRVYMLDEAELAAYPQRYLTARDSCTRFSVLGSHGEGGDACSLILCDLQTGRRHQIRAQLAGLGFPIIGDKTYSHDGHYYLKRLQQDLDEDDYRELGARHQLLHAWRLQLNLYGESLAFADDNLPPSWPSWVIQLLH